MPRRIDLFALLARLALVGALGCPLPSVGVASAGGISNAPVRADMPPEPGFALRPSSTEQQRIELDPDTGTTAMIAVPLRSLIGRAHGVHPRDVQLAPDAATELDLESRYDVIIQSPSAEVQRVLAMGLARSFTFRTERASETVPINRLQRLPGEPPLDPSTATEPRLDIRDGRFAVRGAPIKELVTFLRWRSPRPVLDETGLDERYDFILEWDPRGGTNALFLSLNDLRLQIVRGREIFPFLLVHPDRPPAPVNRTQPAS